jgi:hypothetical protein
MIFGAAGVGDSTAGVPKRDGSTVGAGASTGPGSTSNGTSGVGTAGVSSAPAEAARHCPARSDANVHA